MQYAIVFKNQSELLEIGVNVHKYTSKDRVIELIGYIVEVQEKSDDFKDYVTTVMDRLVELQSDNGWNWFFNDPDIIIDCAD